MASKTKGVGKGHIDGSFLGFSKGKIQTRVNLLIGGLVVDGGWDDTVFDRQYRGDGFDRASGTK